MSFILSISFIFCYFWLELLPFSHGNEWKLFCKTKHFAYKIPKRYWIRMLLFMQKFIVDCFKNIIETLTLFSCCLPSAIWLDALESQGKSFKHWLKSPRGRWEYMRVAKMMKLFITTELCYIYFCRLSVLWRMWYCLVWDAASPTFSTDTTTSLSSVLFFCRLSIAWRMWCCLVWDAASPTVSTDTTTSLSSVLFFCIFL